MPRKAFKIASNQSFLCELYEVTKEHVDAGRV